MCGIAGFIGKGSLDDLESMRAAIEHRGPDDKGLYYRDGVGLAHTRLSILDVSEKGKQPMWNQAMTVAIVFNGEVYNFRELREELSLSKSRQFTTGTDTEVILALYEEYGEECFEKLNGMFAIALYDFRVNKLLLARDRFGKKPLYWGIFDGTFMFGSELKALLKHPSFRKEISLESLNKYLAYEYVPTPNSIFKDVYKLEPASCLSFQNGEIKKKIFWRMSFVQQDVSLGEALKVLDHKLEESVKRRLISDVPLGVFLSGGIDSSTVAYYAQKNSKEKIKTFSIGFEDENFDESDYAKQVSDFLGTDHYSKILSAQDLLEMIPHIGAVIDEPLADASIIPTLFLSEFAKKHVSVALGGDGGDELFAGYPTFKAEKVAGLYSLIPSFIRNKIISKIVSKLPVSYGYFGLRFKAKKFIDGFGSATEYRHQRWLGSFVREDREKLFKKEVWEKLKDRNEYEEIDHYLGEVKNVSWSNKLIYLYLRTYLMDEVLVKVDRASMFHALEVRAPFLDFTFANYVNSLAYKYKSRMFTTKYILKKLMKDKLPENIIYRRKQGFSIPLAGWLRNELKDFCNEILSEQAIKKAGLFDFDYIQKLKEEHFSGQEDNRKLLWTLLIFQLWYNQWS
ncbi:MAG: asparagine synthase (glutamine-hydrolyzing) [Patescibacteria group bacterium]